MQRCRRFLERSRSIRESMKGARCVRGYLDGSLGIATCGKAVYCCILLWSFIMSRWLSSKCLARGIKQVKMDFYSIHSRISWRYRQFFDELPTFLPLATHLELSCNTSPGLPCFVVVSCAQCTFSCTKSTRTTSCRRMAGWLSTSSRGAQCCQTISCFTSRWVTVNRYRALVLCEACVAGVARFLAEKTLEIVR